MFFMEKKTVSIHKVCVRVCVCVLMTAPVNQRDRRQ